jgi:adenosine/AMP kinase
MDIRAHTLPHDESINIILGMSHFIKTVDDLCEIMNTTAPYARYGVAFNEASGPALVRSGGNDDALVEQAAGTIKEIGAGHSFIIMMRDCFPINVLGKIKNCDEVVSLFCATANPVTVLTVSNGVGSGIIGVIDGVSPRGVETEEDVETRRDFLRKIGYKF